MYQEHVGVNANVGTQAELDEGPEHAWVVEGLGQGDHPGAHDGGREGEDTALHGAGTEAGLHELHGVHEVIQEEAALVVFFDENFVGVKTDVFALALFDQFLF